MTKSLPNQKTKEQYMTKGIQPLLLISEELLSGCFKVHILLILTQAFNCMHRLFNYRKVLPRAATPKVTMPNAKIWLEGYKAPSTGLWRSKN